MPSKKSDLAVLEAAAEVDEAVEAAIEAAVEDAEATLVAEWEAENPTDPEDPTPEVSAAAPTPAEVLLAELEAQGVPRSDIVLITDDITGRLVRVELA